MVASQKKGQLPTKICVTCGLPFEYRKKWRNNWPEVKYCSEKCQRTKKTGNGVMGNEISLREYITYYPLHYHSLLITYYPLPHYPLKNGLQPRLPQP